MTDKEPMKIYRKHGHILFPMYEDEGYNTFLWWEIYECDCYRNNIAVANCECLYGEEPCDTADTLAQATAIAKRRYADIAFDRMIYKGKVPNFKMLVN